MDEETARLIRVTQTYFAAIYAVTVWDWIVSLPTEYQRIWKAQWSLIKVLYLANRYYTLLNLIFTLIGFNGSFTAEQCGRLFKWEPGLAALTTIFAEAILLVRTYALWGKDKWILASLMTSFIAECCILFFAVTRFEPVPTTDASDPNSTGACIAGGGPGGHDWSMAYWVSPIVMDTFMLTLTIIRAFQYRRRGVNCSLLQTFVRDGIIYFVVVFVVNLINTIFYSLPTQALQAVNSPMSLLMTSVMASRIVLSLRAEEKESMESVSKDWKNTFLRNKHGGTKASGSRLAENGILNAAAPRKGIVVDPLASEAHDIHLESITSSDHPFAASRVAGRYPALPGPREVRVDVERGVVVDRGDDKSGFDSDEEKSTRRSRKDCLAAWAGSEKV